MSFCSLVVLFGFCRSFVGSLPQIVPATSSEPSCLGDLPGPSNQPCTFQPADPCDLLPVSRKRTSE